MDQVTVAKSEFRMRQWAGLIRSCQSSGQTVVSWCAENGINIKTYYYWLRKLRLRTLQPPELPTEKVTALPINFKKLEVQSPIPNTQAAVIVHLPNASLEIQNGASQKTIEAVLLALNSIC